VAKLECLWIDETLIVRSTVGYCTQAIELIVSSDSCRTSVVLGPTVIFSTNNHVAAAAAPERLNA
jgi:hypothetical protein